MENPITPPRNPVGGMFNCSPIPYPGSCRSHLLQQERLHAASKQPRRTQFVLQADSRLESISKTVLHIRKRVMEIQTGFKNLEVKVNRLSVVKEQACFFMSPQRVLSSATSRRSSPMQLTFGSSNDSGYMSPPQDKLVEYVRRKKMVSLQVSKMFNRIESEKKELEQVFQTNNSILRYKRAERCLIKMISLQSKIKMLGKEFEGLEERLSSEDSFDNDSIYNISH